MCSRCWRLAETPRASAICRALRRCGGRRRWPRLSTAPTSNTYGRWEIHMMYRPNSGAFASSVGDVTVAGRPGVRSPRYRNAGSLPPNGARSTAEMAGPAGASAETVQARLFEAILLVEIVQLQGLAKSMTSRGTWGGADEHRPHRELSELGARIEEVHRLLRALRNRFPHGPVVGGRSEGGLNSLGDRTPPAPGSRPAVPDRRRYNSGGRQIVFPMAAGRANFAADT
jgi:hypothetical protein